MSKQLLKAQERKSEDERDTNQKSLLAKVYCTDSTRETAAARVTLDLDFTEASHFAASCEAIIANLEQSVGSVSRALSNVFDRHTMLQHILGVGVNRFIMSIAHCDGLDKQAWFAELTSYCILWRLKIRNAQHLWLMLQCVARTASFIRDTKNSKLRKLIEALLILKIRSRCKT